MRPTSEDGHLQPNASAIDRETATAAATALTWGHHARAEYLGGPARTDFLFETAVIVGREQNPRLTSVIPANMALARSPKAERFGPASHRLCSRTPFLPSARAPRSYRPWTGNVRIVVIEEAVEKPEFGTEKGKTDARADGTPEARKGWAECPPFHCEVGV
jgi:hypothetical protein